MRLLIVSVGDLSPNLSRRISEVCSLRGSPGILGERLVPIFGFVLPSRADLGSVLCASRLEALVSGYVQIDEDLFECRLVVSIGWWC